MTLNDSIRYHDGQLYCDDVSVAAIADQTGTPVYIYSLKRALTNFHTIHKAFAGMDVHIHYSAKANANLRVLQTLIQALSATTDKRA